MLISRSKVEAFKPFGLAEILSGVPILENVNKQYSVKEIILNEFSKVRSVTIKNNTSCFLFLLDGLASINFEQENVNNGVSPAKTYGAQFMRQMLSSQLIVMVPPMRIITVNVNITNAKLTAVTSFPVDGVSGLITSLPLDGNYSYRLSDAFIGTPTTLNAIGLPQKNLTNNSSIIIDFFDSNNNVSDLRMPISLIKHHAFNSQLEGAGAQHIFDSSLRNNAMVISAFSKVTTYVNSAIFTGNAVLSCNQDGFGYDIRADRQYSAFAEFNLSNRAFFDGVLTFRTDNNQNAPTSSMYTIFTP
jgi:hypothetical protein